MAIDSYLGQLVPPSVFDQTIVGREPPKPRVMEGDQFAVNGPMHIGFQVAVAQLHSIPKRSHGVLRRHAGATPVSKRNDAGVVEKLETVGFGAGHWM